MPASTQRRRTKRAKAGAVARTRRRTCFYCNEKLDDVDYKAATVLRRFVSDKGKIRSRRVTGACRRHQRQVAVAVKRARTMALLPYADR
jgi:small subunit ribosomal protein S18